LSELAMEEADEYLKIPMVGFTESFNISVASAIILHNLSNRLRTSEVPWQLSDAEKDELRLEWAIKTVLNVDMLIKKFAAEESK